MIKTVDPYITIISPGSLTPTLTASAAASIVPAVTGATGAVSHETVVALHRLGIDLELSWLQSIAARATVNLFRQLLWFAVLPD